MAFVVDHKLRQESAAEARYAVQWAEKLGLEAEVIELRWDYTDQTRPKKQKILEEARHLRYAALAKKCREHRISWLLVGHHAGHWLPSHRPLCAFRLLDDEIEGFLMRGLRGSGLMGLAGMEEVRYVDRVDIAQSPVFILRPFLMRDDTIGIRSRTATFLDVHKQTILGCLRENSMDWISDPSNTDSSYFRVRIRQRLEETQQMRDAVGSHIKDDITCVLAACKHIRRSLEHCSWGLFKEAVIDFDMLDNVVVTVAVIMLCRRQSGDDAPPYVLLDLTCLRDAKSIVVQTLLTQITMCLRPASHPPDGNCERLVDDIIRGTSNKGARAFGGCLFRRKVCRERDILRIEIQRSDRRRKTDP